MRYFYQKPDNPTYEYGERYSCDHPVYSKCTLYRRGNNGLAVIQQRYDPKFKLTWWGPIDADLVDALYTAPGFLPYLALRAGPPTDGIYPTVTVRQLMWALKLKPLPKEKWETVFDRANI